MLSIRAVRLNAGSRRSTSGWNIASRPLVGGIGPANVPVELLIGGTGARGSSATPSSPIIFDWNVAMTWLLAAARGIVDFAGEADSSELGPDFRLLMSNAVTR